MTKRSNLLILTGPSCVGKSPLVRVLGKFHPDDMSGIRPLVLYNSRLPRPGEKDGVDYHFRTRGEIDRLAERERVVAMDVRGDLQALDIEELAASLEAGPVLYEGNPFIAKVLQTDRRMDPVPRISLFVSPVSREEVEDLLAMRDRVDPADVVTDIMRRKLLRRTRKQKGELSLPDLENIERRAGSAWKEIRMAPIFDAVVVNHDGEDSENWDAFPLPVGEARLALQRVREGFFGKGTGGLERWNADLFKDREE